MRNRPDQSNDLFGVSAYREALLAFFKDENVRHLLLCGDAEQTLQALPDNSVHTCITSPPYWALRSYSDQSTLGSEATPLEYVEHLKRICRQLKRVLRKDGSFWLNIGDTYREKNLCGIPWRVALALQDEGWILRNSVIWNKLKGGPDNATDKLRNVHEYVFHFVQSLRYYYDLSHVRVPPRKPSVRNGRIVTPTGVSGVKYERQIRESEELTEEEKRHAYVALNEALRKVASGEMPDFRMIIRGTQRFTHSDSVEHSGRAQELVKRGFCILPYHEEGTKPGDVWNIIPEDQWRKDSHYAVFPVELCEIPIRATCPESGIVLDPFVGTGSTIVASVSLGRRAIGIDISSDFLATAEHRIVDIQQQMRPSQQLSLRV